MPLTIHYRARNVHSLYRPFAPNSSEAPQQTVPDFGSSSKTYKNNNILCYIYTSCMSHRGLSLTMWHIIALYIPTYHLFLKRHTIVHSQSPMENAWRIWRNCFSILKLENTPTSMTKKVTTPNSFRRLDISLGQSEGLVWEVTCI